MGIEPMHFSARMAGDLGRR